MAKMFRAVRHIGQIAEKFRFELLVDSLSLKTPHKTTVCLEWVRGPKRTRSREVTVLDPDKNGKTMFSDPLVLIATLFRPSENQPYVSKASRLQFVETGKDSGRVLGEIIIDLASWSNTTNGRFETFHAQILRCLDPNASATIVIGCTALGPYRDDEEDVISLNSGLVSLASSDATLFREPARKEESRDSLSSPLHSETNSSHIPSVSPVSSSPTRAAFPLLPPSTMQLSSEINVKEKARTANQYSGAPRIATPNQSGPLENPKRPDNLMTTLENTRIWEVRHEKDAAQIEVYTRRIASLENQLHEKDAKLIHSGHQHMSATAQLERELSREKQKREETMMLHIKEINARDENVEQLLKQLEEIHVTLERAQQEEINLTEQLAMARAQIKRGKMSEASEAGSTDPTISPRFLTPSSPQSPSRGDQVDVRAAKTIERLQNELNQKKEHHKQVVKELDLCQKTLQLERAKHSNALTEWRREASSQQASYTTEKSVYMSTVKEYEALRLEMSEEKHHEQMNRLKAEKELALIRKQLLTTDQGSQSQVAALQKEIAELNTAKNEMRRAQNNDHTARFEELDNLKGQIHRKTELLKTERKSHDAERDALRKRIYELEMKISQVPLNSVHQVAENTQSLQSGLNNRLVELEDELINTKLSLAQSETTRDEQLDKCRHCFNGMRNQIRTYATLVSDLEVQLTEAKIHLKHHRRDGSASPKWPVKSLKSFFKPKSGEDTVLVAKQSSKGIALKKDNGGKSGIMEDDFPQSEESKEKAGPSHSSNRKSTTLPAVCRTPSAKEKVVDTEKRSSRKSVSPTAGRSRSKTGTRIR